MLKPNVSADVYTDMHGLAQLRENARQDSDGSIKAVAQQFEALFLQMVMKNMRSASIGDDLFGSSDSEFFNYMYDQQLAISLSKRNALGLADMLVGQLAGKQEKKGGDAVSGLLQTLRTEQLRSRVAAQAESHFQADAADDLALLNSMKQFMPNVGNTLNGINHYVEVFNQIRQALPEQTVEKTQQAGLVEETTFTTPTDFVETLWSDAERAGRKLGVEPALLIAQAALESGWGKHVLRDEQGGNSHNLFGIKAGRQWKGDSSQHLTREYDNGKAVSEQARFRVYGSYSESFDDYVRFVQGNPRYLTALQQTGDAAGYIHALQKAGYATDPAYGDKVLAIFHGDTLKNAMVSVVDGGNATRKG